MVCALINVVGHIRNSRQCILITGIFRILEFSGFARPQRTHRRICIENVVMIFSLHGGGLNRQIPAEDFPHFPLNDYDDYYLWWWAALMTMLEIRFASECRKIHFEMLIAIRLA